MVVKMQDVHDISTLRLSVNRPETVYESVRSEGLGLLILDPPRADMIAVKDGGLNYDEFHLAEVTTDGKFIKYKNCIWDEDEYRFIRGNETKSKNIDGSKSTKEMREYLIKFLHGKRI